MSTHPPHAINYGFNGRLFPWAPKILSILKMFLSSILLLLIHKFKFAHDFFTSFLKVFFCVVHDDIVQALDNFLSSLISFSATSQLFLLVLCCNPSLGLATKAKGLQGCGLKGSPKVTSHTPRSVRKCEGGNSHTPKATPTLGDGVLVDSRNFREQIQ